MISVFPGLNLHYENTPIKQKWKFHQIPLGVGGGGGGGGEVGEERGWG